MSILKTSLLVVCKDTRKLTHYFGKQKIKESKFYLIFSVLSFFVPQSSQIVGEKTSVFIIVY